MDKYCVLGNPVEHSKSPWIHARFAQLAGQQLEYGKRLVPLDGFVSGLKQFRGEGGRGCNITVPFKFEAAGLATTVMARARLARACNTQRFDGLADGFADNTDGVGLVNDVQQNAGVALAGRDLLLIGAGGAAAGVLALDMMYGAAANGFIAWARSHGAVPRDGLGMLVEQAAEAFLVFRGVRPPPARVLAELRATVG